MLDSDYEYVMEDGKVLLFVRNGIFQARIYKGDRGYLYRSLKTTDLAVAQVSEKRSKFPSVSSHGGSTATARPALLFTMVPRC
jgi:hypothetical protein